MAEQPRKKPDTQSDKASDKKSPLNWNDFEKLQEAKMAKQEKIPGPMEQVDCDTGAETSAYKKFQFAPLSNKRCCPFNSADWDRIGNMTGASARAKRDIASLYSQPLPGVFFIPKEEDFTCIRSMIIGNFDTPYEGGFFFFYVRFGPHYPFEPPRVCSMSCYRFGHKVRFNPNLYEDGTVCLSILGTWTGPAWTAANTLSGVLLSIQSLLCDQALCNEPGFASRRDTGDQAVAMYDVYVRHETLRVAVIHTIQCAEEYKIPPELISVMKSSFMEYYDSYIASCDSLVKYDGQKFRITLRSSHMFSPDFNKLKRELSMLHAKLLVEDQAEESSPSQKKTFIKDNTPAACSSPDSSLSEFSEDSSPPISSSSPAKDETSPASASTSSTAPCQHETSQETTLTPLKIGFSKAESPQRNPLEFIKMVAFSKAAQSIRSNTLQEAAGPSASIKKLVKRKVLNTKVANVVKINSAPCEKILQELSNQDAAVASTSSLVNMEQSLDFLSFLVDSESDYEELSDSDQPLENEDDPNVTDACAKFFENSGNHQKLLVESTPGTRDNPATILDINGGGSSGLLCEGHTQSSSSLSPQSSITSDYVGSDGDRTDEQPSEQTRRQSKSEESVNRGNSEEDSAGRGLKRESSGVIKAVVGGEECSLPPTQ